MDPVYYRKLLAQPERLSKMNRAIQAAVTPGDIVVDIGTGIGTYAVMAVRAGASRVYALEPGRVADVAARVFEVNGVRDRVVLLRQRADETDLPEQADLIITEDFAPWFFDDHLYHLFLSSRQRILKEEGGVIPARITVRAAPWGGPSPGMVPTSDGAPEMKDSLWKSRAGSSDFDLSDVNGIDLSPLEESVRNTPDTAGIPPGGALADGVDLFEWNLARLDPEPGYSAITWTTTRSGVMWGLGLWMEMTLWPGIEYSNAPDTGEMSWGQGHFPLSSPLPVEKGTVVEAEVTYQIDPTGMVWWRWEVQIEGEPDSRREGNTFRALTIGECRRRSLAETGCLPLNQWAAVDAFLLQQLQEKSLPEAAAAALEAFPDILVDTARARRRTGLVRERYVVEDDPVIPPEMP